MIDSEGIPVYKVGAVVLRQREGSGHSRVGQAETGDQLEVLIVRPKPTDNPDDVPDYALPRGSRAYQTRDVEQNPVWEDVRDDATARQVAHRMEPLHKTMLREMEEEAGLKEADLLRQDSAEVLGARTYHSTRKNKSYDVHWFVLWPDETTLANRNRHPEHASETRWCTVEELEGLVEQKIFSKHYLEVVKEAVKESYYERLPRVNLSDLDKQTAAGRG